ncbi:hypothetical protein E3U43_021220 [Larimichthys crocea]|uniref:Uncharacterized protein n=1 Tax=Larimichthys crocea TaxID=215358 RepID=A0ACD3R5Q1_LARCR|nr:hypothetical protein E3U43_021220 [Larimichthys crocea]
MAEFAAPDGKLSKHNKRAARIKRDAVCISGAYGSYYNKKATDSHCKDQQLTSLMRSRAAIGEE